MSSRKCPAVFFCDYLIYACEIYGLRFPRMKNLSCYYYGIIISVLSKTWIAFPDFTFLSPSFMPYSHGNVTFSILTPGPNHRPGYNDFYNTKSLQEFVKATQIRLYFHGQYYTTETPVSLRHRYYGVDEITIIGR